MYICRILETIDELAYLRMYYVCIPTYLWKGTDHIMESGLYYCLSDAYLKHNKSILCITNSDATPHTYVQYVSKIGPVLLALHGIKTV